MELSSPSVAASIHYTLDGKEPTLASPLYVSPLVVSNSTVIRARCFEPDRAPSLIAGQAYTIAGPDMQAFNSNLPLVIINTIAATIPEGVRTPAYLTFLEIQVGRSRLLQPAATTVRAGIEIRGSSSTQFPKKSYGFELQDEQLQDAHVSLLGMPKEADWVLYAPYTDKSLMRDVLAYELSEAMGHYSVRRQFVEVFLDRVGNKLTYSDYVGVYVLLEKIKQDKNRVDVEPLPPTLNNEPEIEGGYIIKKDRLDANDSQFTTRHGQQLGIEEPKQTTIAQRNWIKGYFDQFENALYGANFRDPVSGYAAYIDADSFVDQHWIVEFAKNIDGFRLSEFMYKSRGGKIVAGPIWDYNLSFGNANYLEGDKTNGWYWPQLNDSDYPWRRRLFQDADFNQKYIDRWAQLREEQFSASNVLARVDRMTSVLGEAANRNYQRWKILGTYVWPNPISEYTNRTYQGEVNWMKKWIEGRLNWIDRSFLTPPKLAADPGAAAQTKTVSLTAPAGAIWYTLDGSDPRLPGGRVSPKARSYGTPINVTEDTRIVARAAQSNNWSGMKTSLLVVAPPTLAISELMYHSLPGGNHAHEEDYEYIKLNNFGSAALNLSGVKLSGAVDFLFDDGKTVDAGGTIQDFDHPGTAYTWIDPPAAGAMVKPGGPSGQFLRLLSGPRQEAIAFPPAAAGLCEQIVADLDFRLNAPPDGALPAGSENEPPPSAAFQFTLTQGLAPSADNAPALASATIPLPDAVSLVVKGSQAGGSVEIHVYRDGSLWTNRLTSLGAFNPADGVFHHAHLELARSKDDGANILLTLTPSIFSTPGATLTLVSNLFVPSLALTDLHAELRAAGTSDAAVADVDNISAVFRQKVPPVLGPGESILIVKNQAAFAARYGDGLRVAGEFDGALGNSQEPLKLTGPLGQVLADFSYHDSWYPATDGLGWSLVAKCLGADCNLNDPETWRASTRLGGSPDRADPLYLEREPAEGDPPPGIVQAAAVEIPGSGLLKFTFFAAAGSSYEFQFRTDLTAGAWRPMAAVPAAPFDRVIEIFDSLGGPAPARYYRVTSTPGGP